MSTTNPVGPDDPLTLLPLPPAARAHIDHLRRKLAEATQARQAAETDARYWRDEAARYARERDAFRAAVAGSVTAP